MKKVNPFKKRIDVGDRIMVHAYKYNGWLYRTWEYPLVIENDDKILVLALYKTKVLSAEENSLRSFPSMIKKPKFWFFFKDTWFNVIATIDNDGVRIYINLASPYLFEEGAIKYYDFDLDFKTYPKGQWKEVDINEFFENQHKYRYPKKLIEIINNVEKEIEQKINSKEFMDQFNKCRLQELQSKFINLIEKRY